MIETIVVKNCISEEYLMKGKTACGIMLSETAGTRVEYTLVLLCVRVHIIYCLESQLDEESAWHGFICFQSLSSVLINRISISYWVAAHLNTFSDHNFSHLCIQRDSDLEDRSTYKNIHFIAKLRFG